MKTPIDIVRQFMFNNKRKVADAAAATAAMLERGPPFLPDMDNAPTTTSPPSARR